MTDWKKRYSVWIQGAATAAGIVVAVVDLLNKQDAKTPLTVVALGVVTLVAAKWPQVAK